MATSPTVAYSLVGSLAPPAPTELPRLLHVPPLDHRLRAAARDATPRVPVDGFLPALRHRRRGAPRGGATRIGSGGRRTRGSGPWPPAARTLDEANAAPRLGGSPVGRVTAKW